MKKIYLLIIGVLVLAGLGCSPSPNQIQTPEEIKAVPRLSNRVYLGDQQLTSVPGYVFQMRLATELDLSNNKLTGALPAEVRQMSNLKILNLSNNEFTGLPAEIGQLQKLEILDVSNNQITGLPLELGNLKNLKTFILTGNNASKIDLDQIKEKLTNTKFVE